MSYIKREWTIENPWKCSSCKHENQGRVKKCVECGSPKDDSDVEHLPSNTSYENRVTDAKLLKQFDAGPDWVCKYCDHHETKLASKCSECGGKQGESYGRDSTGAPAIPREQTEENKAEMREIIARGKRRDEREKRKHGGRVHVSATGGAMIRDVNVAGGGSAVVMASGNSSVSRITVGEPAPAFAEEFADAVLTKDRWWRKLVTRLEAWHGARRAQTLKVGDAYRETTIDIPGSRPDYLAHIEKFGRFADGIPWKKIGYVVGSGSVAGIALLSVAFACFYFFATRDANASVVETRWSYHVSLRERRISHGSDWRDTMHAHAFDVSCSRQVRSHHNCDPYSCNPHSVGHDCRCRNVESCHTSCSSRRNGSSSCREVCSSRRSCSTCYSTEYDTCWHSCPDYDDHCEYQYPEWPQIQQANLGGVDHTPVRPSLLAVGGLSCPGDEEVLHAQSISQCTVDELTFEVQFDAGADGHWATRPESRREYDRFVTGRRWHVQYNHAGMFRPMEQR